MNKVMQQHIATEESLDAEFDLYETHRELLPVYERDEDYINASRSRKIMDVLDQVISLKILKNLGIKSSIRNELYELQVAYRDACRLDRAINF